jgi:hypothetical protein
VHADWMLARLLHPYPRMPPAAETRALFGDDHRELYK